MLFTEENLPRRKRTVGLKEDSREHLAFDQAQTQVEVATGEAKATKTRQAARNLRRSSARAPTNHRSHPSV